MNEVGDWESFVYCYYLFYTFFFIAVLGPFLFRLLGFPIFNLFLLLILTLTKDEPSPFSSKSVDT